jgi:hypothetical protein
MTDRQVNALAAFVSEGRGDWQAPGVVAELRRQREHYDPWQLAVAMIRRASDPSNTTPRLQQFDQAGFVACRRHPNAPVRTDGRCGVCHSEAREDTSGEIRDRGGKPIPAEARRLIDEAIHGQRQTATSQPARESSDA